MHQQAFIHTSSINIENLRFWPCDFQTDIGFRLRGIWRYAQDTVPIRACLFHIIKALSVSRTVDLSSTIRFPVKNINKNSVWGR